MNVCGEVFQTVWVSICLLARLFPPLFFLFSMSHISAGGSGTLLNEVCKSVPKTHELNWGENGKMGFGC